jgi:hypothetical protein
MGCFDSRSQPLTNGGFMAILIRSILCGSVLLLAAATADAQPYYPWYSYPAYPAYPYAAYTYPPYYSYGYRYPGSAYYGYRPTPYNDPYVARRPYSDGAGPKASGHTGY